MSCIITNHVCCDSFEIVYVRKQDYPKLISVVLMIVCTHVLYKLACIIGTSSYYFQWPGISVDSCLDALPTTAVSHVIPMLL